MQDQNSPNIILSPEIPQNNPSDSNRNFKTIFTILIVVDFSIVCLPWLLIFLLTLAANNGVSGTEFIGLLLLPFLLAGYLAVIATAIIIPWLLYKYRPSRYYAAVSITLFILALGYIGLSIGNTIHENTTNARADRVLSASQAINLVNECKVTYVDESTPYGKEGSTTIGSLRLNSTIPGEGDSLERYFLKNDMRVIASAAYGAQSHCSDLSVLYEGNLGPGGYATVIDVERASVLLKSCKILAAFYRDDGVMYGQEAYVNGIGYGYENNPVEIYISKIRAAEMLPIIHDAQKKCPDLHLFRNQSLVNN